MTEARAGAMGQYSHNNQPCHHIPYLFALLGDSSKLSLVLAFRIFLIIRAVIFQVLPSMWCAKSSTANTAWISTLATKTMVNLAVSPAPLRVLANNNIFGRSGEMGAWAVLSSLGLFVVTPGTTDYVLGRYHIRTPIGMC